MLQRLRRPAFLLQQSSRMRRLLAGALAAVACALPVQQAMADGTSSTVRQPAPAPAAVPIAAQSWAFDDPAGTALTAVANGALGGSAWTANLAGVTTNGAGALRLGYNSSSTANTFAPLNIVDGGVFYLSATFQTWDIRNGAASGSTRPIFNLGLRSAAGTSSSLVADVQFTATASGVTMLVRDAQSDFTANAVTLPATLPGPLTLTLKIDKTTNPATYSVTYAVTGGAGGSFGGNLGTTSTTRQVSHVSLALSGNFPGTVNVAPLLDALSVAYEEQVIVLLPPANGRPGKPSNLVTWLDGNPVQSGRAPVGGPAVLLMGGGTEVDAAFTTQAYPINAGGDIVVLRASGGNGYQAYMYTDLVAQLPAKLRAALQPNSVETLLVDTVSKANSAYVADAVSKANLIWLAGGDQSQYTQSWRGTALAAAVKQAYARGAVVGGTSAGMVVNGEWMYDPGALTAATSAEAVADPYRPSVILTTDLFGLDLGFNLVPEPHFANRDRMGRLLTFMARLRQDARTSLVHGVGLDECTSLFINKFQIGTFLRQTNPCSSAVVSANGYLLREERRSTQRVQVAPGQPLIYRNVQRHKFTASGQTFDFARGVTATPATPVSAEGALPVNPY
jgi:cyanophycinase-like exopeptidase